jgi:hypothetical protein
LSAQAILDIKNGHVREGLNWIQKDMSFYRRILAAKDAGAVEKMIALMQIQRYAIILSLLIGENDLRGQDEILRSLLVPLDVPKESFKDIAWWEYTNTFQSIYNTPTKEFLGEIQVAFNASHEESGFGEKLALKSALYFLYKQNMTANLKSEIMRNWVDIVNETPVAILSSEDIDRKAAERAGCTYYCGHLKNLAGETLVLISTGVYDKYFLRIYDADALLRLVRAQLEYKLAAKQVDAEPTKILASLPPETFNPYTDAPFYWDAERGAIGFQPANSENKDKWVEIRLSNP